MDSRSPLKEILDEFQYRNSSVDLLANAPDAFQNDLVTILLSKESHCASMLDIEKYFGPYRIPGTTAIGLRSERPELFQDTLDSNSETYHDWLFHVIHKMMDNLYNSKILSSDQLDASRTDLIEKMLAILEFKSDEGIKFRNLIPQQTYEDYFMLLLLSILHNSFDHDLPDTYAQFNAICHKIALTTLEILETRDMLSFEDMHIRSLIHIAVLSGYVGVNLKSTASAASTLLNRDLIPINRRWVENLKTANAVPQENIYDTAKLLIDTSLGYQLRYGIDCTSQYTAEVIQSKIPTLVLFFTDDYLETILDLKRFELLLNRNPNLTVLVVPRNGRYGNDFAFSDINAIESEVVFKGLKPLKHQHRLIFSPHGPKGGCIDPRFLSQGLIEEIQILSKGKKIILETKGCRNFEMLKGQIQMPWYASFNCNRALSIRTVGVDIDPVFLRIPPGLNAYDGFEMPVIGETPSKITKGVRFSKMTTIDLLMALEKGIYKDLLSNFRHESRLNAWLMRLCNENNLTIPELLDSERRHAFLKTP